MMVRKVDPNRWIIPYADLITLLLALFIVLYSSSLLVIDKYQNINNSISLAFKKQKKQARHFDDIETDILKDENSVVNENLDFDFSNSMINSSLDDLAISLNKKLEESFTEVNIPIKIHSEWLQIDLDSDTLFSSGSSFLKPQAEETFIKIAEILRDINLPIIIEGYTDNRPINNILFASNWELSASRAAIVVSYLEKYGVRSDLLSALGFGSNFPKMPNDTAIGRQANRRVSITILKHNPRIDFLLKNSMNDKFDSVGSELDLNNDSEELFREIYKQDRIIFTNNKDRIKQLEGEL